MACQALGETERWQLGYMPNIVTRYPSFAVYYLPSKQLAIIGQAGYYGVTSLMEDESLLAPLRRIP